MGWNVKWQLPYKHSTLVQYAIRGHILWKTPPSGPRNSVPVLWCHWWCHWTQNGWITNYGTSPGWLGWLVESSVQLSPGLSPLSRSPYRSGVIIGQPSAAHPWAGLMDLSSWRYPLITLDSTRGLPWSLDHLAWTRPPRRNVLELFEIINENICSHVSAKIQSFREQ